MALLALLAAACGTRVDEATSPSPSFVVTDSAGAAVPPSAGSNTAAGAPEARRRDREPAEAPAG